MFKFLKNVLTDENVKTPEPKYNLMAVDERVIRNWHNDKIKLSSEYTKKEDTYNTNENPNKPTKSRIVRLITPKHTALSYCRNPFGLPQENDNVLYYVIRYGVALVEEDHEPASWSDYNYYMNKNVNIKPILLVLVPKNMQDTDEDYKTDMSSLDNGIFYADYHDGTKSYHINLRYITNEETLRGADDEFAGNLRRAFENISIARLLKKYGVSENYNPLLFPEHKEYADKLLSLESLYKETLINASKLTVYFYQESDNMNFETRMKYIDKIKAFSVKLNQFIQDYYDLTDTIDEFNENLGKKKVELKHEDFLSQFD